MKKNPVLISIAAVLVIMIATPAFPAEELFDSAAAAKHMEQGFLLLKAKKFDAAAREFEEAASINPDAESYYYLGYAYYLKGRSGDVDARQKSRENFARAYEIDPNFSPTRYKTTEPVHPGESPQNETPSEAQIPANQQESLKTGPTPSAADQQTPVPQPTAPPAQSK